MTDPVAVAESVAAMRADTTKAIEALAPLSVAIEKDVPKFSAWKKFAAGVAVALALIGVGALFH